MTAPVVAIVGTRFDDFEIEAQVLAPLGVEIRSGAGRTAEGLLETAGEAAVILAGAVPRFDSGVIRRLKARGIVRYGIGTETIDLEAARNAGLWVAYVPDYGTGSVALHATTLVMAALRRLVAADHIVKSGQWDMSALKPLRLPSSLTAGILGFGRIGHQVAKYLTALGFHVIAADANAGAVADTAIELVDPDELLRRSDVLLLHLPGRDDGVPVIGREELDRLPEGAVVINTSRGSVLDTTALIEALKSGRVGHAGLDVFEREPVDAALFAPVADRVTLTPHMAWYTLESERDLRTKAAMAARAILQNTPPDHFVVTPGAAV